MRKGLYQIAPISVSVGHFFFLINDWCERAQPTVGSATAGQVLFPGIAKEAKDKLEEQISK